jgi:UDP-glucose 4-epimerase
MPLAMQTIWITGARGFIGRHLAKRLSLEGMKIFGLGHGAWTKEEYSEWGVENWINGDVVQTNLDNLTLSAGIPSVIFHLAGGSSVGLSMQTPEEDFRRSVDSTIQLLEWMRNHAPQTKLVFASSAAVYGAGYSGPISETEPTLPYSPYGYHKRVAELLIESYSKHYALSTAIVRMFSVYGPELRKQLLWDLCNKMKMSPADIVLAGSGDETRDWLGVEDAANYLLRASEYASPELFLVNSGAGIEVSVKAIVALVCDAWGWSPNIRFNGRSRRGDPFSLVADVNYGQSAGFIPTIDLRDGIREYVNWFRQQGAKEPS